MADTLQIVVVLINTQLNQEWLNECPICFSLSSSSSELNLTGMTQRTSDTLQLVVELTYTQLHWNKLTSVARSC
jgi:hypothetical protein